MALKIDLSMHIHCYFTSMITFCFETEGYAYHDNNRFMNLTSVGTLLLKATEKLGKEFFPKEV